MLTNVKKRFKSVLVFIILPMLFLSLAQPIIAGGPLTTDDLWGDSDIYANFKSETGLGNADPRTIIASVIRVVLGFLGVIAVIIVMYAGFLWMTAGGNEDNVSKAKQMMGAGVIGLVIILAAFGIATFVMNVLVDATA